MPIPVVVKSSRETPGVIIGAGENGLGAIRSLAAKGVSTIVVACDPADAGLWSRHPIRKLDVRSSENWESALLSALQGIQYERPALIPTADVFVSFVNRHRRALASRFDFCLPEDSLTEALLDKARQYVLVRSTGIPLPKTVENLSKARSCLSEAVGFPFIVKPRRWADKSLLGAKNRVVRSQQELGRFLNEYNSVLEAFLAQEIIPGSDNNQWVCNCTFGGEHRLVSAFTFQRLRLSPAHRGVTSYAISKTNPQVISLVARLGEAIRYTGPAMVEFKFDERDGQYKYFELNARIGLCNYFDTVCGVNNVYNTYCLAKGKDVKPTGRCQRDGVMYLSLYSDLYARIKDGETLPAILRHYVTNAWRPHVGAYFSWSDLRPGIVTGCRQLWSVLRSGKNKLLRRGTLQTK